MMGIQPQLILTACFVNSGWALVQSPNPIDDQVGEPIKAVSSNVDNVDGIQENTFSQMKEELRTAHYRNLNKKINLYRGIDAEEDDVVIKREIDKRESVEMKDKSEAGVKKASPIKRKFTESEKALEMACLAAETVYEVAKIGIETAREAASAAVTAARQIGRNRPSGQPNVDESFREKTKAIREKAENALKVAREEAERAREVGRSLPSARTTVATTTAASATTNRTKTKTKTTTETTTAVPITTAAAALRMAEAAREAARAALQAAETTLAAAESTIQAVRMAFVDAEGNEYSDGQITCEKLAGNTSVSSSDSIETSTKSSPAAEKTTEGKNLKEKKKKKKKKKKSEEKDEMEMDRLRYSSESRIHF